MKLGLNLGCGKDYRKNDPEVQWINVDLDPAVHSDLRVSVERVAAAVEQKFDIIEANDILEHIHYSEDNRYLWMDVLKSWAGLLKSRGTMRVQVPDPDAIARLKLDGTISERLMNRVVFGESTNSYDHHYQLISLGRLKNAMTEAGLVIVEAYNLHICAIVIGGKL